MKQTSLIRKEISDDFTREDMVDVLSEIISDSLDLDWTSRIGAEAVVRKSGMFELYEIAERLERSGFGISQEFRSELKTALSMVRDEQVPS